MSTFLSSCSYVWCNPAWSSGLQQNLNGFNFEENVKLLFSKYNKLCCLY